MRTCTSLDKHGTMSQIANTTFLVAIGIVLSSCPIDQTFPEAMANKSATQGIIIVHDDNIVYELYRAFLRLTAWRRCFPYPSPSHFYLTSRG